MNEFHGYSLFNDVEDVDLRAYNRARVMANMLEQHTDKQTKKITQRGAALVFGYMNQIPDEDRRATHTHFSQHVAKDGYVAASTH
jgi:hypothetical protein